MAKNKNWTREQVILAFNQYCKMPFGKINHRHPEIIKLAEIIGRTPSAVSLKLGNLASFDPAHKARGVGGLKHSSKLDREIWDEFSDNWEDLSFESEKLLAEYKNEPLEKTADIIIDDLPKEGKEREQLIKTRVNQAFFRKNILSAYGNKCCITGISMPDLLIASHIKPWSIDKKNRLNPSNGLCLNALHDKAFDKGLITLSNNYELVISDQLRKNMPSEIVDKYFYSYKGKKIELPERFLPDPMFLEFHRNSIFESFKVNERILWT